MISFSRLSTYQQRRCIWPVCYVRWWPRNRYCYDCATTCNRKEAGGDSIIGQVTIPRWLDSLTAVRQLLGSPTYGREGSSYHNIPDFFFVESSTLAAIHVIKRLQMVMIEIRNTVEKIWNLVILHMYRNKPRIKSEVYEFFQRNIFTPSCTASPNESFEMILLLSI